MKRERGFRLSTVRPKNAILIFDMFSSNGDGQFGGFSSGAGGANGAGGPPPLDGLFESAFEELDDEIMERLILDAAAKEDRKYEFLDIGLAFHEKLRSC
ncbi:MAG: hypothetical protein RLZZ324_119 [Candidatus Parcubacteria bacterium]|jgi:hypothetical protein